MTLRTAVLPPARALALSLLMQPAAGQVVGDVLPPPSPGCMDIHHVNTGEGNAAFFVFPDGTTMLFDCGDGRAVKRVLNFKAPRRPDESRPAGEWVARYIQRFHPEGASGVLDYLVISHFHNDHMGGVPDLLRQVRVHKVLDRAWPDYKKSTPFEGEQAQAYKAALTAHIQTHGATVEQFQPGATGQIALRRQPAGFPGFEVRNIAANGEVWTGSGTETRARMPAGVVPSENCSSIAMRIRYRNFDYFSGGDLPGAPAVEMQPLAARRVSPEWLDMESPVAWVTGPVDVVVLNHHGGQDTTNAFFLSVLRPRVCIAQVWDVIQVTPGVLKRIRSEAIYPGPRDIFATNSLWDGHKEHLIEILGEEAALRHVQDLQGLAANQGHIVIRVAPDGSSYTLFVLDDSRESFRIRSVHGKYDCQ